MPVEIKETSNGGYYLPFDGIWDSKEDDEVYAAAKEKYEEMKSTHDYVALIKSHDLFTHGYWIETEEKDVRYPDNLLNSFKGYDF